MLILFMIIEVIDECLVEAVGAHDVWLERLLNYLNHELTYTWESSNYWSANNVKKPMGSFSKRKIVWLKLLKIPTI